MQDKNLSKHAKQASPNSKQQQQQEQQHSLHPGIPVYPGRLKSETEGWTLKVSI